MPDDDSKPTYAEIQNDRFRKELPGTIGCVSVYSIAALFACASFIPSPYGVIAAIALIALYVGAIITFGQGSILEMGVMAVILLILCCQCGKIVNQLKSHPKQPQHSTQNGG